MRDRRSVGGVASSTAAVDARTILNVKQRLNKRRLSTQGLFTRKASTISPAGGFRRAPQNRFQQGLHTTRGSSGSLVAGVKKLVNFTVVAAANPRQADRLNFGDVIVQEAPARLTRHVPVPRTQGFPSRSSQWINPAIRGGGGMRSDNMNMTMHATPVVAQPRYIGGDSSTSAIPTSAMFMNAIRDVNRGTSTTTPGIGGMSNTLRSRLTTSTKPVNLFRVLFTKLASTVSDDDVKELCATMDDYVSSRLMRASEAEAFYSTAKAANEIVALYNGRMLDGVAMDVRLDKESNGSRSAPAAPPISKMTPSKPSNNRNRGGGDDDMEVDRDLITAALFAKKDDKIAFTVKI